MRESGQKKRIFELKKEADEVSVITNVINTVFTSLYSQ